MLSRFKHSEELLEEVQKERLYPALVQQLKKDFRRANIAFGFKGDPGAMELGRLVHEKIYYLILERFQDYLNLLYIVDIPEGEVDGIAPGDAVDLSAQVSFLLLRREAQKVRYKARFGG